MNVPSINRAEFRCWWQQSLLLYLLLAVVPASAVEPTARSSSAKEPELRAAYIFNFAKFTTWSDARRSAATPLVIGVLGDEAVANALSILAKDRTINGSIIHVRSLPPESIPADVRIVYVGESEDRALRQLAPTLFTPGRLTIGETETFLQAGGIIRMFVDSDRLRFDIDRRHAEHAGLTLSSQLLMLARRVTTRH